MRAFGRDTRWTKPGWLRTASAKLPAFLTALALAIPANSPAAEGSPAWKLSYSRQYGFYLTSGVAGQAELFATNEDGSYADIGMTNDANSGIAIFGSTGVPPADPYTPGNVRVTFDINNTRYDFHVYDPTTPSDRSPDCYWLDGLPHYGHYRWEFWWRYVEDDSLYEFFPNTPAYHFDQVVGVNDPPSEPDGFMSDAFGLSDWADYQAQTFVVPEGINRIIGAKAFAIQEPGRKYKMTFSIREGGPTGPQVGPSVTSREIQSNEWPNVKVAWGMEDVPVTPGETYAVRVEWPGGFNMYATNSNRYFNGILYNGSQAVSNRDMIAVVVGARRIELEPAAARGKAWPLYDDQDRKAEQ
jgi:hypothetical protein